MEEKNGCFEHICRTFGAKIISLGLTDSTNLCALEYAEREKPTEPIIFIAEEQSAGRGRLGRTFLSPKGGIYITVLTKTEQGGSFLPLTHNLMIEIAQLSVSRVFLFKEQTYHGRCLVAYKDHVNDLFELSDEERNAFMADVTRVTRAMDKVFHPEKINYGAYSDKLSHLHFHLAPKYVDGPDYGGTFQMNPGKVYLTDQEYQEMIEAIKAAL